jgi:hypothetical protein
VLLRFFAYVLAGIPAAIGVGFVARFAYVTSDTPIDGASSAFLFGMIAVGAYAGPAVAIAVGSNGRKVASGALWVLACLAMLTNWSQTLGAVAHRGAGTEAEAAKLADTVKDDRGRLARIERERAAMTFVATDAEAVKAAQTAVLAAERTRIAECGNGDPRQRGNNCRLRETQEADARQAETAAVRNKALTVQAAKLDSEAAGIRARLAKAPAVKEGNALGEALGRLLPLSAATAATAQQGLISAIVELLIAAALALPELLTSRAHPKLEAGASSQEAEPAPRAPANKRVPAIGGVKLTGAQPATADNAAVARFMLACLPRSNGQEVEARVIYARFCRWCSEMQPALTPLEPQAFAAAFKSWCERGNIRVRRDGGKLYCVGVRLVA